MPKITLRRGPPLPDSELRRGDSYKADIDGVEVTGTIVKVVPIKAVLYGRKGSRALPDRFDITLELSDAEYARLPEDASEPLDRPGREA
jgi:hypothetical protein